MYDANGIELLDIQHYNNNI